MIFTTYVHNNIHLPLLSFELVLMDYLFGQHIYMLFTTYMYIYTILASLTFVFIWASTNGFPNTSLWMWNTVVQKIDMLDCLTFFLSLLQKGIMKEAKRLFPCSDWEVCFLLQKKTSGMGRNTFRSLLYTLF